MTRLGQQERCPMPGTHQYVSKTLAKVIIKSRGLSVPVANQRQAVWHRKGCAFSWLAASSASQEGWAAVTAQGTGRKLRAGGSLHKPTGTLPSPSHSPHVDPRKDRRVGKSETALTLFFFSNGLKDDYLHCEISDKIPRCSYRISSNR